MKQRLCRSRKKKAPMRYDVRLIDRMTKTLRVKRCRRVERDGHRFIQPMPYRNCFSVLLQLRLPTPADTSPRSRQDQLPFRSPMIDLSYFDEYQGGPVTQGIYWPSWLSDSISRFLGKKNGIPIPKPACSVMPTPFRRPVSSAPPAANPPGILSPAYPETISCERIKGIHQTAPPHPPPSLTHRKKE